MATTLHVASRGAATGAYHTPSAHGTGTRHWSANFVLQAKKYTVDNTKHAAAQTESSETAAIIPSECPPRAPECVSPLYLHAHPPTRPRQVSWRCAGNCDYWCTSSIWNWHCSTMEVIYEEPSSSVHGDRFSELQINLYAVVSLLAGTTPRLCHFLSFIDVCHVDAIGVQRHRLTHFITLNLRTDDVKHSSFSPRQDFILKMIVPPIIVRHSYAQRAQWKREACRRYHVGRDSGTNVIKSAPLMCVPQTRSFHVFAGEAGVFSLENRSTETAVVLEC